MARKHEAVGWLRGGFTPSQIAQKMGISVLSVMGYLYNQVGERQIRLVDILFSIDQGIRQEIEDVISRQDAIDVHEIQDSINSQISPYDLEVYLELRDTFWADMYEAIRNIETRLHKFIKATLQQAHGSDWWRKGIPEKIRIECATLQERDPEPAEDRYCYTTFIHLREILKKEWQLFSKVLPKQLSSNSKKLMSTLVKLNRIRNSVMHPVKNIPLSDEDFQLTRQCREDFAF